MVVIKNSREVHIETQRLNIRCKVFQAELCGIGMAVDWIQNQQKGTSSYAINVNSKAALLAITNKHSTYPLAADIRRKIIKLRTTTKITFHWIKGHTDLKGNERADYLAKTVVRYNPNIT
jgi:ribonuclease HI